MLKGTTRIELTDVNTGEVETYQNSNMVTNALRDVLKPLGLSKRPNRFLNEFVPYYEHLLGGILCFDTEIPEDADNYYPPAKANLTGCAVYGEQNNTKNTVRGGFNQTESEVNLKDRYVKYVYDFATSQANGTIASVCLTHKNGGFTSYGSKNAVQENTHMLMQSIAEDTLQYVYPSNTGAETSSRYSGLTIGKTEMIFVIDHAKDCAYYFKVADKSHIHITRRKTYLKSVSILENIRTTKPLIEEVELPELGTALDFGYLSYNYDPATDCLYICTSPDYRRASQKNILVTEIKLDTWKVKQYEVVNTTDITLATDSSWFGFVTGGYLCVKGYDSPRDVYKIQISNPANVVKLNRINATTVQGVPKLVINGRIYYDTQDDQLMIADMETNEIITTESMSLFNNYNRQVSVNPVRNEPLVYFCEEGTYSTYGWYMMCNYLATINNLDAPITKTADKTMKITYILQEQ